MGCGVVQTIPRASALLIHLFFWGENNHILVLVVQGNLAPVYFNIFGMKEKKNTTWKKKKNRDKLFIYHKY